MNIFEDTELEEGIYDTGRELAALKATKANLGMEGNALRYHKIIEDYFKAEEAYEYVTKWQLTPLRMFRNKESLIKAWQASGGKTQHIGDDTLSIGHMDGKTNEVFLPEDYCIKGFDEGDETVAQQMCTIAKHEILHSILKHAAAETAYLKKRHLQICKENHIVMNSAGDYDLSRYYNERDKEAQRRIQVYGFECSGLILEDAWKNGDDAWKYLTFEELASLTYQDIADRLMRNPSEPPEPEGPPPKVIIGVLNDPSTFTAEDGTVYSTSRE